MDVTRRRSFTPTFLVLVNLLHPGCSPEAAPGPQATIRDSAGVAIIENRGSVRADVPAWRTSAEPLVTIGSLDGPEGEQLFRVRGAFRLQDGRIAVGNAGTNEVRIYRADGNHLRTLGGEGEGPGEFSFVRLAGTWGDSLVVLDRRLRRVSVLHPDEGFARSFTPQEAVGQYLLGGWALQGGTLLIQDLFLGDENESMVDGYQRSPVPLTLCDREGSLVADLGELPGADQFLSTQRTDHGIATVLLSVPFGRSPQIAVSGDRIFFGSQDSYELGVYAPDGDLRRLIRLDRSQIPLSEADLAAFIESDVADRDPSVGPERRRQLEEMPRMEFLPPHGAIHADAQGYFFVEEYRLPGDDIPVLNVFDPEGRLTGRLTLPAGLQILEIGEDYVLGLVQDEMGVEYLSLYELYRPA